MVLHVCGDTLHGMCKIKLVFKLQPFSANICNILNA